MSNQPARRYPKNLGETEVFRDVHFHWATTLMAYCRPGATVATAEEAGAYIASLEAEIAALRSSQANIGAHFSRRRSALRHVLTGFRELADDN